MACRRKPEKQMGLSCGRKPEKQMGLSCGRKPEKQMGLVCGRKPEKQMEPVCAVKGTDRRLSSGGFTMIEVVVSTALLIVTVSGFLMMTGYNTSLLARDRKLDRSNYHLSAMAAEGEGETTGRNFTVEFTMEDSNGSEVQVEEIFDEYSVSGTWGETESSMTFYRHR